MTEQNAATGAGIFIGIFLGGVIIPAVRQWVSGETPLCDRIDIAYAAVSDF